MAQVGSSTARTLLSLLRAESGLPAAIAAIALRENIELPSLKEAQILAQNVAFELADCRQAAKYPAICVYCDRITNKLKEKFRRFSGTVHMTIEVRVSQDRLEGLERALQMYVEAVTEVLESTRGDWGDGSHYSGGYEVGFHPVKQGGKNYVQVAKITFDVDVSVN